jgi:hypothetical protein
MISLTDAESFLLLFKGKSNTYVKNELPKTRPEQGEKIKTVITNNRGEVNSELIAHHLEGDFGVGICPVCADNKCYFGVLDIDYYKGRIRKMLDLIREYQLPLLPFRSKSGGLHCYLMLSKAITAKKMRETLEKISYIFSLNELYGKGKVEVFPKQDKAEGFGSSITLPYFNVGSEYTYLLDLEGSKIDFNDALIYIKRHITTIEDVEEALENLPYNDAPPCLQRILLTQAVGSEDSGRNNFLFSFAIYARKKYGEDFEGYVKEVNEGFESPLEDSIVEQICSSVRNNEYTYRCKDIPCNDFCNKTECRKREFGLGRDKGHFSNVDFSGQIYRYNAEDPYYVWQLRLVGQENWVEVRFKNEGDILEQFNFAKLCVRYLNHAPTKVSANDWYAILNTVLPKIINIEVKAEVDTSEKAILHNEFISYLSNKQAKRDSPYQIRAGLAYYENKDGVGKYYFMHNGFIEYLNNKKVRFDVSVLSENLREFGAEPDTFIYFNSNGEQRSCPCWSKVEDEAIKDAYYNNIEVAEGDKASQGITPLGYADNKDVTEDKEKSYTQEDLDNAENLF